MISEESNRSTQLIFRPRGNEKERKKKRSGEKREKEFGVGGAAHTLDGAFKMVEIVNVTAQ